MPQIRASHFVCFVGALDFRRLTKLVLPELLGVVVSYFVVDECGEAGTGQGEAFHGFHLVPAGSGMIVAIGAVESEFDEDVVGTDRIARHAGVAVAGLVAFEVMVRFPHAGMDQ